MLDGQTTDASEEAPAGNTSPQAAGTRTRRRRILVLCVAVATVAAGAVVWSASASDSVAAGRGARSNGSAVSPSGAAPSEPAAAVETGAEGDATSASAAASSAPTAGPRTPEPVAPALPAGWEPRTFQGVTFSVPPGAQTPDTVDPGNADAPALFSWNGPTIGGDITASVTVWIHPAADAPTLGPEYQSLTVPGADQAHFRSGPTGSDPASTTVDVHILSGGRFVNVVAVFAEGATGEQMVRDLLASLSIG